ncbi:hypothetical protein GEV33_000569 [Tenebrio molitor]|uniref:Uncharacterized protein n=1 Tax=Tenebrio molitor TaxID=7067 RepID=A0A8J6HXU9_TENMO|nr:hypothetical protein GEV33_000569 [Tenebrio molitor]
MFKKVNVPLLAWHIDFSKNRLKKIHPEAFTHINGFMYLSFADNYLGELSPNLFKSVKQINTLDFSDNRIANVERIFDDITVNQLILINNTLSCFPTNVFDVSRINFIFLDGNPLTCGCVQMWKHFQMQNNALVVYNMENLERNCQSSSSENPRFSLLLFKQLPAKCGHGNISFSAPCRDISRYKFECPDGTAPVKTIRIRHDDTLVEYVNNQPLSVVHIKDQKIPVLTRDSVSNLPNISEIVITGSGVKEMHAGAFHNLPSLKFLNLSGNLLEEIRDEVFSNLVELEWLHLENNRIATLGDKAFNNLPTLQHLFIDNNKIAIWKRECSQKACLGSC